MNTKNYYQIFLSCFKQDEVDLMDTIIAMLIMLLGIALMLILIFREYALQIITIAFSIIVVSVYIGIYQSYPSLVFAISVLGFILVIICYFVNKK